MKISIVTPSYRNSPWLRLCIPSVADQEGVEHEHIVQDAGSDDGTLDWLPSDGRVQAFVEKDSGMYDAVNRGFRRASGDILAYLNCDEQYLPGTLRRVADFFSAHPEVDILIPDLIVVHADGSYICHRMSLEPIQWHLWHRFSVTTSSLFIRRAVFHERGLWFDSAWRDLGDFLWILGACRAGLRWAEGRFFASIFTETGDNMNLKANAQIERARVDAMCPGWMRQLKLPAILHHRLRLLSRGAYTHAPYSYSLYTKASPQQRQHFQVDHPTGLWHTRIG